MPAPQKQLTPADLAALEHAFAADPASDAYRPLTEAYLAMGRFMEAMVVCKKGVKAHPDDPAARVLLARVYADQGKDRKALEELQGVLQAFPSYAAANRMAGVLHMRLGESEPGAACLRRAAEAAPNDPEVREAIAKYGVASAPPTAAAPVAPRSAASARVPGIPVAPRVAPAPRPATAAPSAAPSDEPSEDVPLPTPVPSRPARDAAAYAQALADKYATQEFTLTQTGSLKRPKRRGRLVTTLALLVVLGGVLGGWAMWSKARKERIEAIDKLLKDTKDLVDRDSYAGYQEAAEKCARILDLDGDSLAGHAYLAYVDALRSGEHGDGEAVKAEAIRHVDAARRLGRPHSHLIAAEAYLKLYGGDAPGAVQGLKAVLDGNDAPSPFLLGVLGVAQLQAGDLDAARDALARAQKASNGDARVAQMLAEQFRRRGEGYDVQAVGLYDYALRLQKDHVPSILGKALVFVDRGQYEDAARAVQLALSPAAHASPRQRALARVIQGSLLFAQGKAQEGAAAEDEALKLDPSNADIPDLVGRRKLRAGDAAGAADAFQRAISADGKRVAFYVDLVRALLAKDGGAKQAIETVKKATSHLGENPRLALLLGDAYRAAGDADLARGQYEKAIALGKPFPDARVALARLFRAQKNLPGALVELTQAIDEYGQGGAGGAALAYVEMAETEQERGGRRELLLDLYEKALQRDPASCDALWGAGKLALEAKAPGDVARQRLDTYAKLCPRAPHAAEAARLARGK